MIRSAAAAAVGMEQRPAGAGCQRISKKPDGSLEAATLNYGRDGIIPPM